MTENTQTNTSGVPTSALTTTPEEEQTTLEEEEEPAVVGGTVAVAVEIMVEVEAKAEDTRMTLQRRAVTLEQFSRAP